MTIEELLKKFEKIKYESMGFPAVYLSWWDNEWNALLRNEKVREENNFKSKDPKEALEKLYNYCIKKGYLK